MLLRTIGYKELTLSAHAQKSYLSCVCVCVSVCVSVTKVVATLFISTLKAHYIQVPHRLFLIINYYSKYLS